MRPLSTAQTALMSVLTRNSEKQDHRISTRNLFVAAPWLIRACDDLKNVIDRQHMCSSSSFRAHNARNASKMTSFVNFQLKIREYGIKIFRSEIRYTCSRAYLKSRSTLKNVGYAKERYGRTFPNTCKPPGGAEMVSTCSFELKVQYSGLHVLEQKFIQPSSHSLQARNYRRS